MISGFRGQYRWLSNFWPAFVCWEGLTFPTVEHAYQAAKTLDIEDQLVISEAETPGKAKRLGRLIEMRPDWERVKLAVMHDLVTQKFARNFKLRELLLATGDEELVEDNTWGDRFWGSVAGVGHNHLGKILMQVREGIK